MSARLFVQRFRRKVDPVGPHDGPRLRVDGDLGEEGQVIQRFQNARASFGREIHVTRRAVAEQQAEDVVTDHGDAYNDRKVALAHVLHATAAAGFR